MSAPSQHPFPRWLRMRMELLSRSSTSLSAEIGATVEMISRWRRGHATPSAFYIPKIAKALIVKEETVRGKIGAAD